jgi:hypothetical protein
VFFDISFGIVKSLTVDLVVGEIVLGQLIKPYPVTIDTRELPCGDFTFPFLQQFLASASLELPVDSLMGLPFLSYFIHKISPSLMLPCLPFHFLL